MYGLEFFKKSLEHKHLLSNYTQRKLEQIEGIEIFSQNELSICSFSMESSDKTKALLKKINENKKSFLSSTTVDENLVIRVAILSFRTKKAHIDHLLRL